jgi:hypothetical protein
MSTLLANCFSIGQAGQADFTVFTVFSLDRIASKEYASPRDPESINLIVLSDISQYNQFPSRIPVILKRKYDPAIVRNFARPETSTLPRSLCVLSSGLNGRIQSCSSVAKILSCKSGFFFIAFLKPLRNPVDQDSVYINHPIGLF